QGAGEGESLLLGVLLAGRAVLLHLGEGAPRLRGREDLHGQAPGEAPEVGELAGGSRTAADLRRTALCSSTSRAIPSRPTSSMASSWAREKGVCSAVPCTSMISPSAEAIRFRSTSAEESSR